VYPYPFYVIQERIDSMAQNSGYIRQPVGDHWYLQLEWTASQNTANSTSYVTANLYWWNHNTYGAVYSSATKDCGIYIDGTWSYHSAGGMAGLSGGQKKLIHSYSRTLSHDSSGNLSVTFDGFFDAEVDLVTAGYVTRIDMAGNTWSVMPISTSKVEVWTDNGWVSGQPYVWNGSSWVKAKNVYIWNGSSWVSSK
jgi:hypothetical protein